MRLNAEEREKNRKFVIENYEEMTLEEMAGKTGLSVSGVRLILRTEGLVKIKKITQEDISFIRKNYPKMTIDELSKAISKSPRIIRRVLEEYNIPIIRRKRDQIKKWPWLKWVMYLIKRFLRYF